MSAPFPRLRPLLLTIAIATLINGCTEPPSDLPTATVPAGASPIAAVPEAAPASATELMRRANDAFRANRIASPAGDNAVEIFLAVRDLDPLHPGLAEALVELMPLANFALEAAIRNRDPAEAERLLALLTRLNSDSAVTHSARTQLTQLRQQIAQEAAAEATARIAAAAPASPPSSDNETETAAASRSRNLIAKPAPAAVADADHAKTTSQPTSAPAVAASAPNVPATATAPASPSLTAPRPIAKVTPDYPPQARSRKIEGFVELEFLVTTSGSPQEIRVVRSEPEGLFDRSAVRALMRWKFKPAERNGAAEATTTRTTMNFRLS
ncbi:MAG: energy transducer TonB [Xanthomonadales bacterium]|nr:energy transducer TonB [Xanthomonadales bacterium]MBK7147010.1 energy transducer TonB [Xanthomonadales bacterium]